jgi:hypothetical protein
MRKILAAQQFNFPQYGKQILYCEIAESTFSKNSNGSAHAPSKGIRHDPRPCTVNLHPAL